MQVTYHINENKTKEGENEDCSVKRVYARVSERHVSRNAFRCQKILPVFAPPPGITAPEDF